MTTPRLLTCTCCGTCAGRWQQHWNQDTGYGLCASCRDWIWSRSHKDREDFERTYGKPGINYAPWPEPVTATQPNAITPLEQRLIDAAAQRVIDEILAEANPITTYYTDRANGAHAAKAP